MNQGKKASTVDNTQLIHRRWREAVPDDRLAHLVKDATRALLRALQMRLAQHSVLLSHWTFLRILWEKDRLTQHELSEQAGVRESTTFFALKSMEKFGLIARRRLAGDRKKIFVFLTPKGRLLKAKLVPLAEEVNEIAVHGVKPTDIAIVRQVLLTIIENLARDEATSLSKELRVPSTREIASLVAATAKARRARSAR